VTRILNGKQERIANGLPSLAGPTGGNAIGPHHVAHFGPGVTYLTVGLGADPAVRDQFELEGVGFGHLVQLMPDGKARSLQDIAGYEANVNPDGGVPDSNPYGLLAGPTGWVVADAGGNSLVSMALGSGPTTLAVFPTRQIEPPLPNLPNPLTMQAVPTSVGVGPDGALYVGELTGFPFPAGEARVYRVIPGEDPSVFADGFTNVIDIAFAPDGSLYVLEMARDGLLTAMTDGTEPAGRLVHIANDGTRTTLASDELSAPGGLAIGPDGALYVTNHSTSAGDGEVLRIKP
jgi:DNA-binding beta-propeller fold protein YncE